MQHSRKLGSRSVALRVEHTVVPALKNPVADSPRHSFLRPLGNIVLVGKAVKAARYFGVIAFVLGVAIEKRCKLFSCYRVVCAEQIIAVAHGNAVFIRPYNRVGVPLAVFYICKGIITLRLRLSLHTPYCRGNHSAGGRTVRVKGVIACANHQIVCKHKHYVVIKPVVFRNVGKRVFKACTRIFFLFFPPGVNRRVAGKAYACDFIRQTLVGIPAGKVVALAGRLVARKVNRRIFGAADRSDRAAAVGFKCQAVIIGCAAACTAPAVILPICRNCCIGCGHGKGGACAGSVGKRAAV